jgi:hypothetical protein
MAEIKNKLKVFLCHASENKPNVKALCDRLIDAGCEPWLDSEILLPGMDWDMEIKKALRASDAVIVCLSVVSVVKEGYIQKEVKFAQDIQDEKPRGTIFLIPLRLDKCDTPFDLQDIQWGDYTAPDGFEKLIQALNIRAGQLGKVLANPVTVEIPSEDLKFFFNIQQIVYQIRSEIPTGQFFEFGDDPGILNKMDIHLKNLYESMKSLKTFYYSKQLLKESNPYFDALMDVHNLQDFLTEVRKREAGTKENTSRVRALIGNLGKSIARLTFNNDA